jgi:hypothetical protein
MSESMQSPPSSPRASPNPLPLTPPATHAPQRLPDKHLLLPSPYPAANPPGYHYLHSYPTPSPQPLQPPSSFAHPLDSLSSHGFSHSHTFASQPQPPQGPTPVHFQSRLAPDRQTVSFSTSAFEAFTIINLLIADSTKAQACSRMPAIFL